VLACLPGTFAFADWPTYAPFNQNTYVNGTCQAGYAPANPSLPTQRLCPAAGTYTSTIVNPCIRAWLRGGRSEPRRRAARSSG